MVLSANFCVSLGVWGTWISDTLLCLLGTERKLRALSSPATQSTIPLCGREPAGLWASRWGLSGIPKLKGRTSSLSACKSLARDTKNRTLNYLLIPLVFFPNSCFSLQSTKILFALSMGELGKGWKRWLVPSSSKSIAYVRISALEAYRLNINFFCSYLHFKYGLDFLGAVGARISLKKGWEP